MHDKTVRAWWVGMLLPALLLAGCGAPRDGRYVGRLVGEPPSPCAESRAVLLVRAGAVKFVPDEGTIVLEGKLTPDGKIAAAAERPGVRTDPSGKRQPFRLGFEGSLVGEHVTGTYATPRCRGRVELDPG